MKKTWISILLVAALLLSSCANISTESTVETTSATTVAAETTRTEIETSAAKTETTTMDSPCETETTAQSITETQETEVEVTTSEYEETEQTSWATGTSYETLPEFEEFLEYSGDKGYYWRGKVDITSSKYSDTRIVYRIRVIGVMDPSLGERISLFYVQALEAYGVETFDPDAIYLFPQSGSFSHQHYKLAMPVVGEEYYVITTTDVLELSAFEQYENKTTLGGFLMPIEEINGKTYVYSYLIDLGKMDCAIKITDEKENMVYKEGKHDDILAALKRSNVSVPTFDYKCEIYAMLKELDIIE